MRAAWLAGALIGTLSLLGGCSDPAETSKYEAVWLAELADTIKVADAAGATDEQRATLARHLESGEPITFEEYSAAVQSTIECARDAGVWIRGPEQTQQNGLFMLSYDYGGPDDADADRLESLVNACRTLHSGFVEDAYMDGPPALEWIDAQFEAFRPQLIACLKRYGAEIAEDAPRDEIEQHIALLIDSEPNYEGPNCTVESGLSDAIGKLA